MSLTTAKVEDKMSSALKPPEMRRTLSARVPESIHEKLAAILQIWKERILVTAGTKAAQRVDMTYVVGLLMAKACDEELAQWGGLPDTAEKMQKVLKEVARLSKQQQ